MAHYPSKSKQHGFIFKIRIHQYSRKGKKKKNSQKEMSLQGEWKTALLWNPKTSERYAGACLGWTCSSDWHSACTHTQRPRARRSRWQKARPQITVWLTRQEAGQPTRTPPSPWLQPNGHRGRWDGGGRRWRRLVELAEARGGGLMRRSARRLAKWVCHSSPTGANSKNASEAL